MRRSERKKIWKVKAWAPTHDWRTCHWAGVGCRKCGLRLTYRQKETREAPTCEEEHTRRTLELVMNS